MIRNLSILSFLHLTVLLYCVTTIQTNLAATEGCSVAQWEVQVHGSV